MLLRIFGNSYWAALVCLSVWCLAAHSQSANILPLRQLDANDLIGLAVYGSTDLTNSFRIGPDGDLRLPLLRQPTHASGLYPAQLAAVIADQLKRDRIMVNPMVTVTILEYGGRPVTVIGAVKSPLSFPVQGYVTILEALARAGGLTREAGAELILTRAPSGVPDTEPEVLRIPLKDLLDNGASKANYRLAGGDEIRVPESTHIYVLGNVKNPGAIPIHFSEQITVLRALAQVGGLTRFIQSQAYIYRRGPSGKAAEVVVPIKQILHHHADDLPLVPDDILYFPEATGRRLTAEAIDRILALGGVAGIGFLIEGR